jgi:hypothetical protein
VIAKDSSVAAGNDPVGRFVELARHYVALIEEGCAYEERRLISDVARILPALYNAALQLPNVSAVTSKNQHSLTNDDFTEIYRRIDRYLGGTSVPQDWELLMGTERTDTRGGWLADDLGDIWRDLKEGLLLLDGGGVEDAIWEWRFSFWHHWGQHLVGALHVIHSLWGESSDTYEFQGV